MENLIQIQASCWIIYMKLPLCSNPPKHPPFQFSMKVLTMAYELWQMWPLLLLNSAFTHSDQPRWPLCYSSNSVYIFHLGKLELLFPWQGTLFQKNQPQVCVLNEVILDSLVKIDASVHLHSTHHSHFPLLSSLYNDTTFGIIYLLT